MVSFKFIILVVIVDPGIKVESGYSAYDDGLKMDIFIKVTLIKNNNSFIYFICFYLNRIKRVKSSLVKFGRVLWLFQTLFTLVLILTG